MTSHSSHAVLGGFIASLLSLAGCNVTDAIPKLGQALDDANGKAEIVVSDLLPNSKKAAVVCPYSGFAAEEVFGRKVFKDFEDTAEGSNWLVWQSENGALVKEQLGREKVDMCSGDNGVSGLLELAPGDTLVFNQEGEAWVLTEIR
ncbi:hypothetical protein JZY91_05900 [Corynebacterium sp. CNCTC7651]|uniref:hypothetical protein n=1 Tax=Corynebacterium sp. CNCTC7651 TaxID=2815361 RepID=UPI001F2B0A7E|nr:hypothetical protein [Corynebacterium sp. CNCTC7651]UIZ93243.1 hypothetical protein JZY91_05900 [Corynebacterium sp. CNCTC7651]